MASLFALIGVFMPYSWMDATHRWLGMGKLPAEPIVGYLARSTSAFYAFFGGLLLLTSFDLYKYRQLLIYIGITHVLFGILLLVIDLMGSLPLFWGLTEGPVGLIFGVIIVVFSCRMSTE
ncbi:MAG: hypothetical protein JW715_00640 [Sedimentisphaerales bacterium]|nr:hypothetical protein [Sedimentisphaerales bacterium]